MSQDLRRPPSHSPRRHRPAWTRGAFALAIALQLVVLYAPRAPSVGETHGIDKVVHLAVFGLVVVTGRLAGVPLWPLVAVSLAHTVISEVVQGEFLAHRDGDWHDSAADATGVLLGALVPLGSRSRRVQRSPRARRSP